MAVGLKAMALFSLLFGIGMAIQFERLAPDPRRGRLLARRLAILLVIGVAHLFLIWDSDILTEYSLAEFIALPFLWGPRWPLAAGASLFLALYLVMPLLPPVVPWPTTAWIKDHVAEARQVYGTGGFLEILAFRVGEVASILPLHVFIFRAPSRYSCSACWCGAPTSFVIAGHWSALRSSASWSEPR